MFVRQVAMFRDRCRFCRVTFHIFFRTNGFSQMFTHANLNVSNGLTYVTSIAARTLKLIDNERSNVKGDSILKLKHIGQSGLRFKDDIYFDPG